MVKHWTLDKDFKVFSLSFSVVLWDLSNNFLKLAHFLNFTSSLVSKDNQKMLLWFKQAQDCIVKCKSNGKTPILYKDFLIDSCNPLQFLSQLILNDEGQMKVCSSNLLFIFRVHFILFLLIGLKQSCLSEHHHIILDQNLVELVKIIEICFVTRVFLNVLILFNVTYSKKEPCSRGQKEDCGAWLVEKFESLNFKRMKKRIKRLDHSNELLLVF